MTAINIHKLKPSDLIVFENDDIVILNKPPMITTDQDNSVGGVSFRDIIQKINPEIMLCHRLDKETSGAIIGAKNKDAYREISILFEKRKITKEYHCVVAGNHEIEPREIKLPITKQANYKAVIDHRDGKPALTIVETLKAYKHFTVLKAQPVTGRFHQIRVHLASKGIPIIGDELYGKEKFYLSTIKKRYNTGKYQEEESFVRRTALHAAKLTFEFKEQPIEVMVPYADDLGTIIKLLERWDSL